MESRRALGKGLEQLFDLENLNVNNVSDFEKKMYEDVKTEEIVEIPINELRPNPYQPRTVFDEDALNELASLTIINKTGGNIIKIFENIENSMFEKQKLKFELNSLTSGSKLVVYTLLFMPFVFVLIISTINPTYFLPFINSELGIILLIFMIIYYIIFIVCIRRIMKVVI